MVYNSTYFEAEVREGFYIPGMIKRSWACQMDVLENIAKVCEKHGIKWFACYGTLLGAVRHSGFIPWDDDIDIAMLRDDFERFLEVAREELPRTYLINNFRNIDNFVNFLTRIVDNKVIDFSNEYLVKHNGFPYISGVDIFVLDYIYSDEEKEKDRTRRTKSVIDIYNDIENVKKEISLSEIHKYISQEIGHNLRRDVSVERALRLLIDDLFAEAPSKGAKQVAVMAEWLKSGKEINYISCFDETIDLKFENMTIKAPIGYEELLIAEFGDWETIVKEGGAHEYPFYKGQINEFAKDRRPLYEYIVSGEEKSDLSPRNIHASSTDVNMQMFGAIVKALDIINKLEIDDSETILELMIRSQEIAVKIGSSLEAEGYKYDGIVTSITDFCELLYQGYIEFVQDGVIIDSSELVKMILAIQTEYNNIKKSTKEVVFIPVKYKDWWTMKKLYDIYIKSPDYDVKVMPIPFHHRNNDGNIGGSEWEYDLFPKELPLIDYRDYDVHKKHPYMYVVQNPWDEYGSGITVDFCFYSSYLWKLTENLVYIPFFEVEDFTEKTEKAVNNLSDYVITPGVFYADKIWLQSENMKKWYMKCILDKTNGDYEKLDKKISCL